MKSTTSLPHSSTPGRQSGVLLVNLGSPDSTDVGDVRRYLRQFLMDERVIDAPWLVRLFLVNGCIVPFRSAQSAEAYERIWMPEGSPLILTSRQLQETLQAKLDLPIELAMRYQNPSIESALDSLLAQGVDNLLVIPLFPHYAMSSYESAVERVKTVAAQRAPDLNLRILPPYYDDPDYIAAPVASAEDHLRGDYDHLLFSFHGLPMRHLKKADHTCNHCLVAKDCCDIPSPAHATCYRAQCLQTVKAFARATTLRNYSVAFQSRLGREPWMEPYTDRELIRLAKSGVKKLLVMCPAFVSDCLETLEEIGMRGRESFLEAGGESLTLVPCLNTHPRWINTLTNWIQTFAPVSRAAPSRPHLCAP